MTLLANARMYSVTPATRAAWSRLFEWVIARSGVDATLVEHDLPKLLSTLWQRADLGAVLMCGLPIARRTTPPVIVAQPVPSPPRYADRAVYGTDIVVAAGSTARTLAETFGQRAGFTLEDSQSGYYAFRHLLLTKYADVERPYASVTGGLVNARGVIAAITDGRIDVGPLDGYVHDLLRHDDPAFAAQVRIVESTEPTPMPAIVATSDLGATGLELLRTAFAAALAAPELAAARATLLLAAFAFPESPELFAPLRSRADRVDATGPWH